MAGDEKKTKIKTLQISNISVSATRDQIFSMCQYLGRIDDIKVYPSDANMTSATTQKVAFVKFDDERCVEVGQHLTNTVLVDRALVCVPWLQETIPDEETFFNSGGVAMAGVRQLPPHVSNRIQTDADGTSFLLTVDPKLEQLGLPAYPSLPGDSDLAKVEEIRRTIYVGNLPKDVKGDDIVSFFNLFGEVMYVRMADYNEALPCRYAYVEFAQQPSIPIALQNNGCDFYGRPLKIQHSRVAIIKPQQKTAEQAVEEIEEAIRMGKDRPEPRSNSPRRRRSPSPRKRSRSRRRSGSRRRSRSKGRRRSGSRNRKRSRSRDKKRSRSRDRRRRSRSRDKDRDRKERDRKRSRSRSRDQKKDKEKDRKDRKRSRSRSRSRDKDRKREKRDASPESKSLKKVTKEESQDAEMSEESLRDILLEKKRISNGHTGSSDKVSDDEDKKTPSKIKNERKRRSDSDSD